MTETEISQAAHRYYLGELARMRDQLGSVWEVNAALRAQVRDLQAQHETLIEAARILIAAAGRSRIAEPAI